MRKLRMPLAVALLLSLMGFAQAVMRPLTQDELYERSDVVALVRVLSVTCVSERTASQNKPVMTYRARLQIIEKRKGLIAPDGTLDVQWSSIPSDNVGDAVVSYFPGEEVWTNLTRLENGLYDSTWWNARLQTVRTATSVKLPERIGDVIHATGIK